MSSQCCDLVCLHLELSLLSLYLLLAEEEVLLVGLCGLPRDLCHLLNLAGIVRSLHRCPSHFCHGFDLGLSGVSEYRLLLLDSGMVLLLHLLHMRHRCSLGGVEFHW